MLIVTPNFDVFVYMANRSPFLQVINLIAKFFNHRAGQEVNNMVIAFMGKRTKFCNPRPVILPSGMLGHGQL